MSKENATQSDTKSRYIESRFAGYLPPDVLLSLQRKFRYESKKPAKQKK